MKTAKNTICLWYDGYVEDAARFYAETFPNSSVGAVHRAPSDNPCSKEGDVLTEEVTVMGIPCVGHNGGPGVEHSCRWLRLTYRTHVAESTHANRQHSV